MHWEIQGQAEQGGYARALRGLDFCRGAFRYPRIQLEDDVPLSRVALLQRQSSRKYLTHERTQLATTLATEAPVGKTIFAEDVTVFEPIGRVGDQPRSGEVMETKELRVMLVEEDPET